METRTVYFEDVAKNNTEETFRLARQRASELKIKDIVVASTRGDTAVKAAEYFKGFNLVIVRIATGLWEANSQLFPEEKKKIVEAAGAKVVTSSPAFSGVAISGPPQNRALQMGDVIANTLRTFGQGMKVTCEIVLQAADAGFVQSGVPVVSIAGTGKTRGADTAIVVSPVNSNRFFELKVHEIICKPRL
jgi:hypothetical protein